MANAPLFNVGDQIWLRESAAIGMMESYKIHSIIYPPQGGILYSILTVTQQPRATGTMGDQITGVGGKQIILQEENLCTYSQALDMCIANLQLQLNKLQLLKAQQGTGSTT